MGTQQPNANPVSSRIRTDKTSVKALLIGHTKRHIQEQSISTDTVFYSNSNTFGPALFSWRHFCG